MLNKKGVLAGALLGCLFASIGYAQIRSGTFTGTVKDTSGAVVAGAQVTVTEQNTHIVNTTTTNDVGEFNVPYLPAGTYTVDVSVSRFVPYRVTGYSLTTAQTIRVDVELRVGAIAQAVEVSAQAAQVQTDSSTVQDATLGDLISAIPNTTQNPMYYAFLEGGVVPRNATADSTSLNSFGIGVNGRRQWSALGVNGGRTWTNDIELDGLPIMGGGYNDAAVVPNTEGLEEVRLIANDFSAQYGHGQSVVSMTTRSGTNQYHGEADYRLRNEALNANTDYNNAYGIARPAFKVNEFGGAVGGPIKKNKLFFFTSYHYLRHNTGITTLWTIPTALEQVGNFSQTKVPDSNGNPIPAQIFNPFSVTQVGTNLYQRAPIPNAIIPNPNPYALTMYSYYPSPNRPPTDAFNDNNFQATDITTVRRHSLNNRIDYRRGKNSFYGSGGLSYANIVTPRPYGKAPFNNDPAITGDKNPYGQIGDIIILSPTTVMDVRFGFNRINTKNYNGNKSGFTDYASFGVPSNIIPLMAIPGSAPVVWPSGILGGVGGGSNWSFDALSDGLFGSKHEEQNNYNLNGSVTKTRGRWTHKAGAEVRNLESNYQDLEEQSAWLNSWWFQQGGNFNFQYVTANGGVAPQNTSNAQLGVDAASMLLGTGLWWIRPGANVKPAFSQKYFALYSQNDWRATSKLTINLGLRWDLQPGPTERHNRMSSVDLTATNAFGSLGAVEFAGANGNSRNLWETRYNNWGPRVGAAYQLTRTTVLRGGYGISYVPSNTGYYSGPSCYGANSFSSGTMEQPYGSNPHGVPVETFSDPVPLDLATGSNPAAPALYGQSSGNYLFDHYYQNGRVMQWNIFLERSFSKSWFGSVGYSAADSAHLMAREFPIQNIQDIPSATLSAWRAQYIASNGVTNPSTTQVTNPFQPTSGPLLGFSGALGSQTLDQAHTLFPYPLLLDLAIHSSHAKAIYNSLQARLTHAFSNGLHVEFNYTWSKELDDTDTMEDDQGFNSGGVATAPDIKNYANNRKVGFSDIPQRVAATFLYELPFGTGKPLEIQNRVLRSIVGQWQTSGSVILQQGMPFAVSGDCTSAAYCHPNVTGEPLEVPKALQHWYNGTTTVTLPDGRQITPTANTYLKYNIDAFSGQVVTTPNGTVVPDVYWYGTVANTLDTLRGPGRFNIDFALQRSFKIRERLSLEVRADATNLLNNVQLNGNYTGGLGNTNTVTSSSTGLLPGMGTSANGFGTIGLSTFDPRQVIMNLRLRF